MKGATLLWDSLSGGTSDVSIAIHAFYEAAVQGYHAQLGDTRWQLRDGPPDAVWQPDLPVVMVGPTLAESLGTPAARLAFDPRARTDTVTDHNVVGVLAGDAARPRRHVQAASEALCKKLDAKKGL